jgi:hypothetical protein
VIIYKFTQGNLGAKKIASQEKKSQIATLATDSAIPVSVHHTFGFRIIIKVPLNQIFSNFHTVYHKIQDKFGVFPVPNSSLEFSKNRRKMFVTIHSSSSFAD